MLDEVKGQTAGDEPAGATAGPLPVAMVIDEVRQRVRAGHVPPSGPHELQSCSSSDSPPSPLATRMDVALLVGGRPSLPGRRSVMDANVAEETIHSRPISRCQAPIDTHTHTRDSLSANASSLPFTRFSQLVLIN